MNDRRDHARSEVNFEGEWFGWSWEFVMAWPLLASVRLGTLVRSDLDSRKAMAIDEPAAA